MTREEQVAAASQTVPSSRQIEWMDLELTAFIHFSLNTFYGTEWGDGTEDPARFNPDQCDPDGWVKLLADCGFKLAILTCKHHGGFCLWPSAYTDYSVKSSPWKQGTGDIVREFSDACHKYGVKFGVYLSPWDRHDPGYAADSEAYNRYFMNQLTELLSNYGPVAEVWFDGACIPVNGQIQQYDWEGFYALIRRLQPDAVISGIGPDVRWVGNEAGKSRPAEWCVVNLDRDYNSFNRECCRNTEMDSIGDHPVWYPAETDTSIRPNWFYHKADDPDVKSLHKLLEIYFNSVGHNTVLLLNLPPDRSGRIHQNDAARLKEFHDWLAKAFRSNLAKTGKLQRTETEPLPGGGVSETYELSLPKSVRFNCIELAEEIQAGQQIERYQVYNVCGTSWNLIAEGCTVGHKELKRLPETAGQTLYFVFSSRAEVRLKKPKLFLLPEIPPEECGRAELYYSCSKCSYSVPEGQGGDCRMLLDENPPYVSNPSKFPASVTLMTKDVIDIQGFVIMPQQDGSFDGTIRHYSCDYTNDGKVWKRVCEGEFGNLAENPVYTKVFFGRILSGVCGLRLNIIDTFHGESYFKLQRFMPVLSERRSK